MPPRVMLYAVLICSLGGSVRASQWVANPNGDNDHATTAISPALFKATPMVLNVATLSTQIDSATISDVAVADFNGDGRNDIAVAWYATDNEDMNNNVRMLTLFFNEGTTFRRGADINLYIPNYDLPAASVFWNGTAAIAVGDFDGDGDKDLAVTGFFGDEIWFIENLGQEQFAPYVRYPFGFNSTGNFLTPPEAIAADFDGDGRDELAYICDPIQHLNGWIVHFWKTTSTIANIQRVTWWPGPGGGNINWTRGLAVADFDGDGRPDLCFSGCSSPSLETNPVLTIWYALNPATGRFSSRTVVPGILCSDVVDVRPTPACRPGVILTDFSGSMQYWSATCQNPPDFSLAAEVASYAGLSPNRGMTAVVADVNGDGNPDLVTKQKLGGINDHNQIEITLSNSSGAWTRVVPTPIDTGGFQNDAYNEILRPRNLAVADLFGNTLPEIVAGFGISLAPAAASGRSAQPTLQVAIWSNGCLGDVNLDGRTDALDVGDLVAAENTSAGAPAFNPNADLNKDGQINYADLLIVLGDFGCRCAGCGTIRLADMNCDGLLSWRDITPFVVAMSGRAAYEAQYSSCNWLNGDCNGDGLVSWRDITAFIAVLNAQAQAGGHARSDTTPP